MKDVLTTIEKRSENNTVLLSTQQLSEMTGLTKRFWEVDRIHGKSGLRFVKIGGKSVRYRLADVEAWIESNLRKSTSDPGNQK